MIYRVKTSDIVHEQIDDEVIIINMNTGNYYSLRGSGSAIWQDLILGADTNRLQSSLERAYHDADGSIAESVDALLSQLLKEEIVEHLDDSLSDSAEEPAAPKVGNKPLFEAPGFEKFSDVQELLLLDPIHDVSESGWPMNNDAGDASA